MQLSSLCLVTLLNTLEALSAGSETSEGTLGSEGAKSPSKSSTSLSSTQMSSTWKSPTAKMILAYASSHRALYEDVQPPAFRCPPRPYSGSHSARPVATGGNYHHQQHQHLQMGTSSRNNAALNSLKSRICGYDAKTFEFHTTHAQLAEESYEHLETEHQQQTTNSSREQQFPPPLPSPPTTTITTTVLPSSKSFDAVSSPSSSGPRPTYLQEDFNYQDRLRALMRNNHRQKNNSNRSARISSTTTTTTTTTTESPPNGADYAKETQSEVQMATNMVEAGFTPFKEGSSLQATQVQAPKSEKVTFVYSRHPAKSFQSVESKKRSQSLHLSLEHLSSVFSTSQEIVTLASLKTTNSDSRLSMPKEPKILTVLNERHQQHQQLSLDIDDSVFEDVKHHDDDDNVDNDDDDEDDEVYGQSLFFTTSEDEDDLTSDLVIASEEDEEDFEDNGTDASFTRKQHQTPARGRPSARHASSAFGGVASVEADSDATLRHFERALAHIFLRKCRTLLPELVGCRNSMLVDDCIQAFASGYCRGKKLDDFLNS